MTSRADKLPLETEPVARDNITILTLKPSDFGAPYSTERVVKGGHDPVSRTNFNKIHASRTVLTKFHESRNST